MTLSAYFAQHPKAALGFSGGVDSSYLLYAARQAGCSIRPYFIKTPFQPQFELEDARRLCASLGAELTVLELDVLADPAVAANPAATTASAACSARWQRGRSPMAIRCCWTVRMPRTMQTTAPVCVPCASCTWPRRCANAG